MPPDVAPADHLARRNGDELRVAGGDHAQDEFSGLRQRGRFEEREELTLAGDGVEDAMKALDVLGIPRDDLDVRVIASVSRSNPVSGQSAQLAVLAACSCNRSPNSKRASRRGWMASLRSP